MKEPKFEKFFKASDPKVLYDKESLFSIKDIEDNTWYGYGDKGFWYKNLASNKIHYSEAKQKDLKSIDVVQIEYPSETIIPPEGIIENPTEEQLLNSESVLYKYEQYTSNVIQLIAAGDLEHIIRYAQLNNYTENLEFIEKHNSCSHHGYAICRIQCRYYKGFFFFNHLKIDDRALSVIEGILKKIDSQVWSCDSYTSKLEIKVNMCMATDIHKIPYGSYSIRLRNMIYFDWSKSLVDQVKRTFDIGTEVLNPEETAKEYNLSPDFFKKINKKI